VIIRLAQAGFGQAVLLQTFVSTSDKRDGAANEEALVVKCTVAYTVDFVFCR
jgi:hypothetical protein